MFIYPIRATYLYSLVSINLLTETLDGDYIYEASHYVLFSRALLLHLS
jgi:hypothetical protein